MQLLESKLKNQSMARSEFVFELMLNYSAHRIQLTIYCPYLILGNALEILLLSHCIAGCLLHIFLPIFITIFRRRSFSLVLRWGWRKHWRAYRQVSVIFNHSKTQKCSSSYAKSLHVTFTFSRQQNSTFPTIISILNFSTLLKLNLRQRQKSNGNFSCVWWKSRRFEISWTAWWNCMIYLYS